MFTVLGILALLARVGFALYAAGLVRAKNSAGAVLRSLADLCITTLAFWAVGAAILFQHQNPILGFARDLLFGWNLEQGEFSIALVFVRLTMILTATYVLGGAVSERCRFVPLCIATLFLAGFVLPVTGNWAWQGWLGRRGFVDLGGGAVLHVAAGVFALVGAAMVGPRVGKFNRDGSSSMIPGHNLPLASTGLICVLIGWIAYVVAASMLRVRVESMNMEAVVGSAAMNVLLAAAAAGAASMIVAKFRYGKPDIVLTLMGILGGLTAISAGGAALYTWSAVIVGAVAGVLVPLAAIALDLRARIDDPLGVIASHVVGGAWGTIATGIFIAAPIAKSRPQQILIQLIGIGAVALFSAVIATAVFMILKATIGLRAKEADEFDGLDLAEHDIGAYPDFQQNSIKSYHLREA